jgi:threonylcarbamoyladenosine tRNA methylthiotransferase CDKAL1
VLTIVLPHLLQYGFTLLPDEQREAADLWLVNTCTVKSPSQSAMDNVISAGRQLGKHLVVAGCVPQGESRQPGTCLHQPCLRGQGQ